MTRRRRLRFGARLAAPLPGTGWLDTVRTVEQLGYSTLSMPDHLGAQYAPIPALAAVAATERLRLTMSVLANDYRHPVLLAKDLATIDALSGGRVELGLGTGWRASDYTSLGLSLDSPGVRLARLEPALLEDSPHFVIGTADQITADLLRYRGELRVSYFVVSGDRAVDFAAVVRLATGA